ncbi:hypothetical protein NE237_020650 [Protea cynaroides]|uniref:Uncharacterized protein n=1 Tax=Protea cynaroides TaxID=273540 RepID=A0A9Q0K3M6_9MAGN|nr:hypothetical protein NE237_020650 [Protea cynaroides]
MVMPDLSRGWVPVGGVAMPLAGGGLGLQQVGHGDVDGVQEQNLQSGMVSAVGDIPQVSATGVRRVTFAASATGNSAVGDVSRGSLPSNMELPEVWESATKNDNGVSSIDIGKFLGFPDQDPMPVSSGVNATAGETSVKTVFQSGQGNVLALGKKSIAKEGGGLRLRRERHH